MAPSTIRLDPVLLEAAKQAGAIQRRSPREQIEYWAALGRVIAPRLSHSNYRDIICNKISLKLEPVTAVAVDSSLVFGSLENSRKSGDLAKKVTSARVYYEANKDNPSLMDMVDTVSGERKTGHFKNGKFTEQG